MNGQWSEIKQNLGKMLDSGIFRVWVAPLSAEVNARGMSVSAPNEFMAEWVRRRLATELRQAAAPVLALPPDEITLEVRVGSTAEKAPVSSAELAASILPKPQAELPLQALPRRRDIRTWHYRFEDFVTGPSNNLAVAAAHDLCKSGQVRSLFINSSSGLGKTHITQAAGQALMASSQSLNIGYMTADQFASRFVAAMKGRELEDLKRELCGLDALLLEDIHFLQRKKAMQEMMLAVVKNLEARGARVIFTSSFSPRQLQDMDGQLISHFCSGILASLEKPDLEMRREILRRKARSFQVDLPEEICDALSRRLSSDVRQLESCLKNMLFKAKLLNAGLSVDLALETAAQYAGAEFELDMDAIVKLVCESYGLTEKQLKSRSRKQEYVQGRNTAFYLARKHTELSLEEIGCIFNRRHSTVQRSITQVEQELSRETRVGLQIARVVGLIERKCGLYD